MNKETINNETFGMSFQYAICKCYHLENDIEIHRINKELVNQFIKSGTIKKIFKNISKPIKFLTTSKKYTSPNITRCPHNFLLENEQTFSIKTFSSKNKKFAPKVVGQPGEDVLNYFFGDLWPTKITRKNFKKFCLTKINEILPIVVDFALVSDYNCWVYFEDEKLKYKIINRNNLPELTYNFTDFSFTQPTVKGWIESNTVKFKGRSIMEIQVHQHRAGFKIRLNRDNFLELLKKEKEMTENNSILGDTAELAVCRVFELNPGEDNDRLVNNSDNELLKIFIKHYSENQKSFFPYKPIKYAGTKKRKRGGQSKSGIDFYLEKGKTLSLKTNKSTSYKVCPPEIGQPSPKTFDLHFSTKGWYESPMDENKFRQIVKNQIVVSELLKEYLKFLNECDFLLWTIFIKENNIDSKLIRKANLLSIDFLPDQIKYSNDFETTSSVTITYGKQELNIGEFQVHSARNSLKFRFNFNNLINMIKID